jgi:hypothetical protein
LNQVQKLKPVEIGAYLIYDRQTNNSPDSEYNMPFFDIVSEVNKVDLRHAVDNASRELSTRFDFRGVEASIILEELTVTLKTTSDFQVRQLEELLRNHCAKRSLDTLGADIEKTPIHAGKSFTLHMTFKQGIDQPDAKEIIKKIKDSKIKVQASIQGDKIRVTGKNRDDLQECINVLKKAEDIKIALQFNNFRD